jgi:hypothetical protein
MCINAICMLSILTILYFLKSKKVIGKFLLPTLIGRTIGQRHIIGTFKADHTYSVES